MSGDFEASLAENNSTENLIASSSKNPRLDLENLEEVKTTLRKEIMSDLTKILAENQKELLKLIAPVSKKRPISSNFQVKTHPVKTQIATTSKTTPVNSRNMVTGDLNDSTNQPTKRSKQQRASNEQTKDRPSTSKILFAPQPQTFPATNLLPMPKAREENERMPTLQ